MKAGLDRSWFVPWLCSTLPFACGDEAAMSSIPIAIFDELNFDPLVLSEKGRDILSHQQPRRN